MDTPELASTAKPIEVATFANVETAEALGVAKAKRYEQDMLSFINGHPLLAVQLLLVTATPVAVLAFEIGKHLAR